MSEAPILQSLSATFSLPLRPQQVGRWRGAWAEMAGLEYDIFHNHRVGEPGLHYRYPLVQYRSQRGLAAIVALNAATGEVREALNRRNWEINWDGAPLTLGLTDLRLVSHQLAMADTWQHYQLRGYLPFNDVNFGDWQAAPHLLARVEQLNRLLVTHLLGFAKGVGWHLSQRLEADITLLQHAYSQTLHEVRRPCFDLSFRTNLVLPPGIALGRGVSQGFGVLVPLPHKRDKLPLPDPGTSRG